MIEMKPYYQDDWATIYHGDCREILPQLPKVDLVLTDPPYPKLKGGLRFKSNGGVAKAERHSITIGTPWGNEVEALKLFSEIASGAVVFCSWQSISEIRELCGGDAVGLATWYKRNTQPSFRNRPHYSCEYIWFIEYSSGELRWQNIPTFYNISNLVAGCFATERILEDSGAVSHPTQKPISLISRLADISPQTILDPFMGSGTTLVAAKQLGRKSIGIEIEEKYCEIAARRLRFEAPPLFAEKPLPRFEEKDLF